MGTKKYFSECPSPETACTMQLNKNLINEKPYKNKKAPTERMT